MADVTVYGFPISTFVNIVRLVLTHKNVAFDFCDLEPDMGSPGHLASLDQRGEQLLLPLFFIPSQP